ncbi:Serine/threonine-protein kinase LMTK1 [Triplophysa tibetana]|uniref:Serine/threonine-protein kinase LMTK1 n=1 Tax=Triplophysa tibetana TaxID=1572043 RepID=A0A5A9N6K4_9TELE|nr:Serine/threonine-protein kinase LMTK1 [Triplophysa tibetana]
MQTCALRRSLIGDVFPVVLRLAHHQLSAELSASARDGEKDCGWLPAERAVMAFISGGGCRLLLGPVHIRLPHAGLPVLQERGHQLQAKMRMLRPLSFAEQIQFLMSREESRILTKAIHLLHWPLSQRIVSWLLRPWRILLHPPRLLRTQSCLPAFVGSAEEGHPVQRRHPVQCQNTVPVPASSLRLGPVIENHDQNTLKQDVSQNKSPYKELFHNRWIVNLFVQNDTMCKRTELHVCMHARTTSKISQCKVPDTAPTHLNCAYNEHWQYQWKVGEVAGCRIEMPARIGQKRFWRQPMESGLLVACGYGHVIGPGVADREG